MRDYNFFESLGKRNTTTTGEKIPFIISMIVILLVITASAGLIIHNHYLEKQIESIDAEIQQSKDSEDFSVAEKLQSSLQAMQEYDKSTEMALAKLNAVNILGTEFMSTLASSMPINTYIVYLGVDSITLEADFSTPNRKEGAELILGLKESGLFSNVHMNSISLDREGTRYTTTIICDLKEGEDE